MTPALYGLNAGKRQLRFRDIRRFGSATLFADADELERFFAESELGPEPFALDAAYWKERLQKAARPLKAIPQRHGFGRSGPVTHASTSNVCEQARSAIAGGPETKNARGFETTGVFFLYRKLAEPSIFGRFLS